ncbi:hypothetical protein J2P12_05925 [Candidatus Bathyarchaeota archaeon]|nr:hypothetical protein [Candidatus Bathyarchaeota archaeon]
MIATGPETPTLPERIVLRTHMPYAVGCLVLGYVFTVLLPQVVVEAVDGESVSVILNTAFSPDNLVNSLFISYLFYAPRYMRLRLLKSEATLSQLLPGGDTDFRRLFGRISAVRPQIVAWALFTVLLFLLFDIVPRILSVSPTAPFRGPSTGLGQAASVVGGTFGSLVTTLVLSSTAWVYYGVLRGIHRMGHASLNLSAFYRDPFLGLKPVGSLALSVAMAYFGFEIFLIAAGIASPPTLVDYYTVGSLLVALVVIGVVAFFFPLRKLHERMILQKTSERAKLAERLGPLVGPSQTSQSPDETALEVLKLDLMDRKVGSIATWPFDFQILGKLTVVTLSVTAALITRFIALFLKL